MSALLSYRAARRPPSLSTTRIPEALIGNGSKISIVASPLGSVKETFFSQPQPVSKSNPERYTKRLITLINVDKCFVVSNLPDPKALKFHLRALHQPSLLPARGRCLRHYLEFLPRVPTGSPPVRLGCRTSIPIARTQQNDVSDPGSGRCCPDTGSENHSSALDCSLGLPDCSPIDLERQALPKLESDLGSALENRLRPTLPRYPGLRLPTRNRPSPDSRFPGRWLHLS